ncbi:MAG: hypothetical protein V4477_16835 [Pseudomonadota bacterium]
MDNPGVKTLAALQIGAARPLALLSPITDLDGMSAVTLEASFQYGSGGASCSAIVATSLDGGTTWRHIARFDFGTAAAVKTANLSGLLSKAVAAYADLVSEGVNDGLLGTQMAVYVVSTGTYTNTTLSVRASVR